MRPSFRLWVCSDVFGKLLSFSFVAKLAKLHLGIPASQASCERLFSIVKNDITESRTSLLPNFVQALLFLGTAGSIF